MTIDFIDINNDLENALDNFIHSFEEYDFTSEKGSLSDIDNGVEGIKTFLFEEDELTPIEFSKFKKLVKKELYSNSDAPLSEIDWDSIEVEYNNVVEHYLIYTNLYNQLEENLTGSQEVESLTLFSRDDVKEMLLEKAIEEGWIYEITHLEENFYIPNDGFDLE